MKNDLNEEYEIDLSDFKFLTEKGLFHIFGEFYTSEINFVRNDQPDITSCVLSLGKKGGQSICPEHESFQNYYRFFVVQVVCWKLWKSGVSSFLLIFFLIFVNILLLNIIIAMFTTTYDEIKGLGNLGPR